MLFDLFCGLSMVAFLGRFYTRFGIDGPTVTGFGHLQGFFLRHPKFS